MSNNKIGKQKFILDLEMLNTYNAKGCAVCGRKFSLGETVVVGSGPWGDGPKVMHENEAVYDKKSSVYIERGCFMSGNF